MADQKISELTALTGANLADVDAFAVVDTSAVQTKKITYAELKTALDTGTGFVRITGDAMTGNLTTSGNIGVGTADGSISGIHVKSSGTDVILHEVVGSSAIRILGASGLNYIQSGTSTSSSNAPIVFSSMNGTTEYARIQSSGMGIGTDPSNKLDVKGTVGFEATNSTNKWLAYTYTDNTFRVNYNGSGADELVIDTSGNTTFAGEVSIAPSSGTAKVRLTSQGAGSEVYTVNGQIPGVANGGFAIRNETDSRNDFTIDAAGAATFGGTVTAPTDIMTGGSQIGQDFAYLKSNSTSTASLTLRKDASGADSIDFLQLRNNGNGLIGTITGAGAIQATGGATSAPTYSFVGDTNTGISRPTSDAVNIVTGGEERVRVTSSVVTINNDLVVDTATNAKVTISDNIGEVGAGNLAFQASNSSGSALKPMGFRAEDIRFATGSDERARIASAGEIQIGGTTNAGFLDFDGTSLQLNTQRNPNTGTFVNTGRTHAGITLRGADADSSIKFYTKNSNNSAGSERLNIDKNGDINIISGNLVVANGAGIDFSATANSSGSMSSELLDDYEEGTWTPSATQGLTGFTIQTATYTKVGRVVTVAAYLSAMAGKDANHLQIGGLPFTPASLNYSTGVVECSTTGQMGIVRTNTANTYLVFFKPDSSNLRVTLTGNDVGTGHIIFSITYQTT